MEGYGFYDFVNDVLQLPGGDYIVTGGTYHWTTDEYDMYAARISGTGALVWQKVFGGTPCVDLGSGLHYFNDNSIVIAGYTCNYGIYVGNPLLVEIDQDGDLKSASVYDCDVPFELSDFHVDSSGNMFALDTQLLVKYNLINTVGFAKMYIMANVDFMALGMDSLGAGQYVMAGQIYNTTGGDLNKDWAIFMINSDGSYANGMNEAPWDQSGTIMDVKATLQTADSIALVQSNGALVYEEEIDSTVTDTTCTINEF